MKRGSFPLVFSFVISGLSLCAGLVGCGGSGSGSGHVASVSINSLANSNIDPGDSVTITGTISHGSGEGLTWSLSGSGCSGSACGALSNSTASSVTYTAPSTVTTALAVTITASAVKDNVSASVNMTVPVNPSITTAAGALAAGMVGTPYSVTLGAGGGITPYIWSVSSGRLPTGLMLTRGSGILSGSPMASGNYSFTITATDSGIPTALTASASFTIAISGGGAITFTTTKLPAGTVNSSYSASISASGGSGTLTYAVTGGTLPTGTALSAAGVLSGTPTVPGTSYFTVTASDQHSDSTSQDFSITVHSTSVAITSMNLPSGTVNVAYSYTFQAGGGTSPYTWSLASGSDPLPSGITLSPAGLLAGTTTDNGSFPFTVKVTDSASNSVTAPYTLIINSATIASCAHDGSGNSILNGHYGFLLAGYDPSGLAYDEVGDFTANGAGEISSGNADVNGMSFAGAQTEQQFTFAGTYSIGSTDNRGTATFANTNTAKTGLAASTTYCFAADTVTSGLAYSGRILEADGSGFVLTGFFAIQDPADFSNSAIDTGFAFGIQGFVPATPNPARAAAIGQVLFNGSGGVTSGQLDNSYYDTTTDETVYSAQLPFVAASSSYSVAPSGRGTLTIAIVQGEETKTISFVTYVLATGSKMVLLSTDSSVALLAGQADQQTQSTFHTSDLNGGAVYREVRTTNPESLPVYDDVRIGRYNFNGSGQVGEIRDENAGGTITLADTRSGTYTVSSSGYLTVTGTNREAPNFYLFTPNAGFGLDASPGVGFHTMLAQSAPGGGFSASTLSGNSFAFGTIAPAAYGTGGASNYPQTQVGAVTFVSGGVLSGNSDGVEAPGTSGELGLDQAIAADWALDTTSSPNGETTGRFVITSGASGPTILVGYVISSTEAFLIEVNSGKDGLTIEADHQ